LACTHPELVAAAAEWFVDQGALVAVGDSPAFGSGLRVMESVGMAKALAGLPVQLLDLQRQQSVTLGCGVKVCMAAEAFECDLLVNLPKLKAHSQTLITLAVKNYFGLVLGSRKAMLHMRHGGHGGLFFSILVDLLAVLPKGISVLDGIVAMAKSGPVRGEPFNLGLLAASCNPVALDTAIMEILAIEPRLNPLWLECRHQGLVGCEPGELHYPLATPGELKVSGFTVPDQLVPIRFQLRRFVKNAVNKLVLRIKGGLQKDRS